MRNSGRTTRQMLNAPVNQMKKDMFSYTTEGYRQAKDHLIENNLWDKADEELSSVDGWSIIKYANENSPDNL